MARTIGPATSLAASFITTAERQGDAPALESMEGGSWSWSEYAAAVRETAAGLDGLGLERGAVLACWLGNRPEFHIADTAALHLGAASFSLPADSTAAQAEALIADAGSQILITEAAHVDAAITVRARGATQVDHIVCIDGDAPQALGWDEMLDAARSDFDFEVRWRGVLPADLATRVYASPAGAGPAGVGLTHSDIAARADALRARLALGDGIAVVSHQPASTLADRLCFHYLPMLGGWQVTCSTGETDLAAAIAFTRPDYLHLPPASWAQLGALVGSAAGGADLAAVGLDRLRAATFAPAGCPPEVICFWQACGVALSELVEVKPPASGSTSPPPASGGLRSRDGIESIQSGGNGRSHMQAAQPRREVPSHKARSLIDDVVVEMSAQLDDSATTVTDAIHRACQGELGEDLYLATRQSTRANMGLITTLIAEDSEPTAFTAPEEALSYARSYVHEGLSFDLLTRAYREGEHAYTRLWLERAAQARRRRRRARRLAGLHQRLAVRVHRRDQPPTQRGLLGRARAVDPRRPGDALRGGARDPGRRQVDVTESSGRLRYRLDGLHLGFVIWSEDSDGAKLQNGSRAPHVRRDGPARRRDRAAGRRHQRPAAADRQLLRGLGRGRGGRRPRGGPRSAAATCGSRSGGWLAASMASGAAIRRRCWPSEWRRSPSARRVRA